jgi:hypothetical protein
MVTTTDAQPALFGPAPEPSTSNPPERHAADRWSRRLLLVVVVLLVLSLVMGALRVAGVDFPGLNSLERWLFVDRESGVPAWFSTVLLLLCAQALWRLADTSALGERRRWSSRERLLAAAFVYLSLDEATAIHEQTIRPLRRLLDLNGALSFSWIVLALPVTAALGLFMLGYLRALPRRSLVQFVLAGVLYVGGAAGVEMVGAVLWDAGSEISTGYVLSVTVEEGLEMASLVLFLSAVNRLQLSVAKRQETPSARP